MAFQVTTFMPLPLGTSQYGEVFIYPSRGVHLPSLKKSWKWHYLYQTDAITETRIGVDACESNYKSYNLFES